MTTNGSLIGLSVHGLAYGDDFYDRADAVRRELLAFPDWQEMRQDNRYAKGVLNPLKQNGLTTGRLTEKHRSRIPECLRFVDALRAQLPRLCEAAGVQSLANEPGLDLEVNAMAYGEDAWLAPHTDSGAVHDGQDRRIAWMLYLTHPDDGEWDVSKGGAVRLWEPGGAEVRLCPRFNRFAMFRVSKDSFHEIERIAWPANWERCRLALSGWIRGAAPARQGKHTSVFLKSANHRALRAEMESRLRGTLAIYRLLLQQRHYCGGDTAASITAIDEATADYLAHVNAPPETSFVRRTVGERGSITVLDEQDRVVFSGPAESYADKSTLPRTVVTVE